MTRLTKVKSILVAMAVAMIAAGAIAANYTTIIVNLNSIFTSSGSSSPAQIAGASSVKAGSAKITLKDGKIYEASRESMKYQPGFEGSYPAAYLELSNGQQVK